MNHFQTMLEHLVRMARMPGAIDQARHRCKELERTDLYAGIGKAVAAELKRQGPASTSKATSLTADGNTSAGCVPVECK